MSTYSFLDVVASISGPGGNFQLGSGAGAADEGITTSFNDAKNTMTPGADGQVMHSLHAAKTGKYTIRLLKTSSVNAQLSQLYASQSQSSSFWGQNTITINDTARGDVITGRQCAFAKHPDVVYAKDGNFNEWEFDVGQHDPLLGTGSAVA